MVKKYKSAEGGRLILESYDKLLNAWGVDNHEEDVQTIYGKTHLITAGDKANPPLLLFHGVGEDSALMWYYNAATLTKRFHIIAVDTMGGPGKSEPGEEYYKSFDQAKWIDGILDAKGLDKVYVTGVSNGSYLTQLYTAKRHDRVIKSMCMSGSIAVKGMKSPILRMMKVFLPEALFPNEKNARKLMVKMCGNPGAFLDNKPLMEHWLLLLKYFNNQSMMYHKIEGFDDAEIAVIQSKTRILLGKCDRLGDYVAAGKLMDSYHISYRIVENAGHALNHEQPELVHEELFGFLLGDLKGSAVP